MEDHNFKALDSLVFLCNRVGRQLAQSTWKHLSEDSIDISPQHMGILSDLWQQDGVRQQDLAVSLIKDKGTIARTISFLEEKNILVRIDDPKDKRTKRIYLTHKGKKLKEEIIPLTEKVEKEVLGQINPEELKTCKKVLAQIYTKSISCIRNEN